MSRPRPILTLKTPRRTPPPQPPQSAPAGATARSRRREQAEALLTALELLNPGLWNPAQPLPLAVGIHRQLYPVAASLGISHKAVRGFLAWWTSAGSYQDALSRPEAWRYNLDGSAATPVSASQRAQAQRRREKLSA